MREFVFKVMKRAYSSKNSSASRGYLGVREQPLHCSAPNERQLKSSEPNHMNCLLHCRGE